MAGNWWDDQDAYAQPFWRDRDAFAVHKADEPGIFEELISKARSGLTAGVDRTSEAIGRVLPDFASDETRAVEDNVAQGLGYRDRADHARALEAQRIASQEREFEGQDRTSSATEAGLQEISAAEGPWEAIRAAASNPRAVAMTGTQSLGMMAPGMVAAAASGPAAPAVVGGQSAAIEYESTLRDTMAEAGIDTTDPVAVRRALDDPSLMEHARERAGKRGLAIGTFDAITAGVAGRLLAGARGVPSAATRTAGELGVQTGGGVAGEAVGQIAADGSVNKWGDVVMEGIAEIPTSITEVPTNYGRARAAFRQREADTGLVQDDYRDLAQGHGATITSLTRTPERNRKVGGVATSQHLRGTAGDFVVPAAQKDAFKADARKRGYEVIDEGDHIHLELPGGKARQTTLEGRREQRRIDVAEGRKTAGTAHVEDALDRAREKRGMPLDRAERTKSSTDKPAPAAPTSLERDQLLRDANDPLKSPLERRAAKRQAQAMPEAPRRMSEQVERLKEELLDRIVKSGQPPSDPMVEQMLRDREQAPPAQVPGLPEPTAPTPAPQVPPSTANQPAQQVAPQAPTRESVTATIDNLIAETRRAHDETAEDDVATRQAMQRRIGDLQAERARVNEAAHPAAQQPQTIGGGRQINTSEEARRRLVQVGYDPEVVDNMTNGETVRAMREQPGWMPPRFTAPQSQSDPGALFAGSASTAYSEALRGNFNRDKNLLSAIRGKPANQAEPLQQGEISQVELEPEQQARLEKLGRVLGRRIVLFDMPTANGQFGGFAGDDRHIFINPRAAKHGKLSLATVVGHEFTHTLRFQGNKALEELIAYAGTKVNKQNSYIAKQRKAYGALYRGRDGVIDDKINEEHVADLIGDIVADDKFWSELAQDDPSLFRRTIDAFIQFLRKLSDRARKLMPDDGFYEIEELRARATAILKQHIKDVQADNEAYLPWPTSAKIIETPEVAADYGLTLEELRAFNLSSLTTMTGRMVATFTSKLGPASDQLERWLLDEFRDVREIQKVIGNNGFGGRVPQSMDFHRNENLRHGAYKDARERAEERFVKPIARVLSKAHLDIEGFSRYLWMRHASERDAYLRSNLDPGIAQGIAPDGLAGVDPLDAQRWIANLDPAERRAYERAAKFVDGMRKFTNDTLLASGQITQERYDAIMSQYEHYVPLRGLPPGMDDAMNAGYGQKAGMSMNRNPIGKRAAGRKSEPENIIEHMVRDMDNALVGQQKQRVLSSLVRLIAAHPDPDLWEVAPITYERKWVNGILTVVQTNGEPDNQITFMHHGVPVKIEIRHAAMRKALLNLNEPMPQWLRRVGKVTRWLSAVKTAFSPFFLLVNPVRDAGLATMGVFAEHGMASVNSMWDHYKYSHIVLAKDQNRKAPISSNPKIAKLQQYAREFGAAGGKTGYTYVNDIREQQRKLRNMMARHSKSPGMLEIAKNGLFSKDGALLLRKGMQHVAHLFEVVNDMAENSTRLAVYAAMRDKGMSVADAASYAKEVTVNFNRRGSFGKILGGFYMFFNAAMQGGARTARLMRNKRFLAIMGSMIASSYAVTLGQMLAAGDDDDGESKYMKAVSDSQAQRTFSIYLGNGKSLSLPVPYGPNIFTYMGHRLARLTYEEMRGKRVSYGKVVGDIMAQAMTSMSPLDPGKGMTAFLPEIARIPIQTAMNKNDFGGPIAPKLDPRDRTGNPNFYDTDVKTGTGYRWLAQGINDLTGGDDYEGGMVNWTGEQVRHVAEQFTGGLGRLASESYELVDNMMAGIDPEPSDVPLANVYFRGKGHKMHAGSYYDNVDDYKNTVEDWKLAVANEDEAKINSILKRAPWVDGAETDASTTEGRDVQAGSVMEQTRDIERSMKALRREKDAIIAGNVPREDGSPMSRSERKRAAYEIDLEIAELQQDFNYAINAGRGNPMPQ